METQQIQREIIVEVAQTEPISRARRPGDSSPPQEPGSVSAARTGTDADAGAFGPGGWKSPAELVRKTRPGCSRDTQDLHTKVELALSPCPFLIHLFMGFASPRSHSGA